MDGCPASNPALDRQLGSLASPQCSPEHEHGHDDDDEDDDDDDDGGDDDNEEENRDWGSPEAGEHSPAKSTSFLF